MCLSLSTADCMNLQSVGKCHAWQIHLKRREERKSWIGIPHKRDVLTYFYDVAHDTFHRFCIYLKVREKLEVCDVHVHHHEWNLPEGEWEAGGMWCPCAPSWMEFTWRWERSWRHVMSMCTIVKGTLNKSYYILYGLLLLVILGLSYVSNNFLL